MTKASPFASERTCAHYNKRPPSAAPGQKRPLRINRQAVAGPGGKRGSFGLRNLGASSTSAGAAAVSTPETPKADEEPTEDQQETQQQDDDQPAQ